MTRPPLPRYATTIALTIDISATDEGDALARLDAIQEFIRERLNRSTFTRLPGKPALYHSEACEPSLV